MPAAHHRLRRLARPALLAASLAPVVLVACACGAVTADRGAITKDLGLAAGAYAQYVAGPVQRGELGPSTPPSAPVAARAARAARYATSAVEAARTEAAPDNDLASFAQKTAAAGASLNAIAKQLAAGRPSRELVAGGTASLESLLAAARDIDLQVSPAPVAERELSAPPVP